MIITDERCKINYIVPEWKDYDNGIENSLRRIDDRERDRDSNEEIVFEDHIEKPSKKVAKFKTYGIVNS